ncbi:MAG TPA: hypothetical protein VGO11_18910 [Chthoniobacteraceae bacterium]|jgi:hypothetical protein|nr:hypothetical protein [Chthoniobacteraceae bacterium]
MTFPALQQESRVRPLAAPPVVVATLIGHRDVEMGLQCLGSLLECVEEPLVFTVHDDGTLTAEDLDQLERRLPVLRVVARGEAEDRMADLLRDHPAARALRTRYIYGLKLFDVPLLHGTQDVALCDSDILFFRRCRGLFSWPDPETGALFMRDWQEAYALRPWHVLRHRACRLPSRLNCGLFFLRGGTYDLDLMEWLVARDYPVFQKLPWLEQTCWAVLAARINARFWSEERIRTVWDEGGLAGDLVAGHFTSTVRGLLAQAADRRDLMRAPEALATVAMPRLSATRLALEQAARLLRRQLGVRVG